MQEEGFLAKVLYPAGAKDVELGKAVAILVDNKEDIAAFANYTADGAGASAAPTEAASAPSTPAASPAPATSYPDHIKLEMPNLSPTMEKGNIQSWGKQVGDEVQPGDVLAAIETDKAVVDFEMQEEGFIAKLMYPEGAKDVELGKTVAILVENKEDIAAFANYSEDAAPVQAQPAAAQETQAAASTPASSGATSQPRAASQSGDRVFISPLAKKLAEEKGLDFTQITGTGPNGRILAADVKEFKAQPQPQAAAKSSPAASSSTTATDFPADMFTDIENSQIRKIIANRLTESKQQIPHYYVTI